MRDQQQLSLRQLKNIGCCWARDSKLLYEAVMLTREKTQKKLLKSSGPWAHLGMRHVCDCHLANGMPCVFKWHVECLLAKLSPSRLECNLAHRLRLSQATSHLGASAAARCQQPHSDRKAPGKPLYKLQLQMLALWKAQNYTHTHTSNLCVWRSS